MQTSLDLEQSAKLGLVCNRKLISCSMQTFCLSINFISSRGDVIWDPVAMRKPGICVQNIPPYSCLLSKLYNIQVP